MPRRRRESSEEDDEDFDDARGSSPAPKPRSRRGSGSAVSRRPSGASQEEAIVVDDDSPPATGGKRRGRPAAATAAPKDQGAWWKKKMDELEEPDDAELDIERRTFPAAAQPDVITTPLLPFQREALWWMTRQEASPFRGGLLCDEMGMGKTLQAITLIATSKDADDAEQADVAALYGPLPRPREYMSEGVERLVNADSKAAERAATKARKAKERAEKAALARAEKAAKKAAEPAALKRSSSAGDSPSPDAAMAAAVAMVVAAARAKASHATAADRGASTSDPATTAACAPASSPSSAPSTTVAPVAAPSPLAAASSLPPLPTSVTDWKPLTMLSSPLDVLAPEEPSGVTLVVCPVVALTQWRFEIAKHTAPGALSVYVYHGASRSLSLEEMMRYDVILTTYSVVEAEFRKMMLPSKTKCEYCGKMFLPEKLRVHLRYFCGPDAKKTKAQAKQQRTRDGSNGFGGIVRGVLAAVAGDSGAEDDDEDEGEHHHSKKTKKTPVKMVAAAKPAAAVKSSSKSSSKPSSTPEAAVDTSPAAAASRDVAAQAVLARLALRQFGRLESSPAAGASSSPGASTSTAPAPSTTLKPPLNSSSSSRAGSTSRAASTSRAVPRRTRSAVTAGSKRRRADSDDNDDDDQDEDDDDDSDFESADDNDHAEDDDDADNAGALVSDEDDDVIVIEDDDEDEDVFGAPKARKSRANRSSAVGKTPSKPREIKLGPISLLQRIHWKRVILDEAHAIKNKRSATARAVFNLKAVHRWCLSGTPLQNRVAELFSLVRFLRVRPYGLYFCKNCPCESLDYKVDEAGRACELCGHSPLRHYNWLNRLVMNPIKQWGYIGPGRDAMRILRREVLDGMLLRRTKQSRAADLSLPGRTSILRNDLELDAFEADFYEAMYTQSQAKFAAYVTSGTLLNNYAHIFDLLTRLRQAVDHPYLITYSTRVAAEEEAAGAAGGGLLQDVCGICRETVEDAVVTGCRHAFCRLCMREYLESLGGRALSMLQDVTNDEDAFIGDHGGKHVSADTVEELEAGDEDEDVFGGPRKRRKSAASTSKAKAGKAAASPASASVTAMAASVTAAVLSNARGGAAATVSASAAAAAPGAAPMCPTCFAQLTVDLTAPAAVATASSSRKSILSRIPADRVGRFFRSSSKIEALLEDLWRAQSEEPGTKAIVFSQFVNMLDLIQHRLSHAGVRCVKMDGSMTVAARDRVINSFRDDPHVTVFLISLKAGGVALNLTAASRIYLMDPWWNPAAEAQAADRTHRLGQHRTVTIVRFIVRGTVEERIIALQDKKRAVFDATVNQDQSALARLTEDDMRFLFS